MRPPLFRPLLALLLAILGTVAFVSGRPAVAAGGGAGNEDSGLGAPGRDGTGALVPTEEEVAPPSLAASPPPSSGAPEGEEEVDDLRQELESILTSTGNRSGKWGVLAVSLDRGDTLLSLNPRDPMVPASNMKVFTTAAALHVLGPDFRYTTFFLTTGEERDGRLNGDLVLYGTGDPSLSDRFFPGLTSILDTLANKVLEAGIREIQGDLIIDGSYFQGPGIHPDWDPKDLNDAFAAPVSAVSFNENLVRLQVRAGGAVGWPPSTTLMPENSGIPILNTATTVSPGSRSRIWLFRDTPWDPIGIEGEIPQGGSDVWRELPVADPLVFTGRILERILEERGVLIQGDLRVVRNPEVSILPPPEALGALPGGSRVRIVAVHQSPPLLDILTVVNKRSNNLLAESVARTLGRLMVGDGSYRGGAAAVHAFLTADVGISPEEISIRDGSGLSAQNRTSAGALVRVLAFMAASPHWEDFWGTLPEAGVWRELRRMSGSPASRNLRGKTGTMDGVSALSGMVRTRSGERVLFSILSNDVASESRAKRAEDQLGIRLASLTRAAFPDIQ